MEFADYKTIYTIFHILGALLGAGSAYVSDALFFRAVRDRVLSTSEIRLMRIMSRCVWTGLGILFISGLFLFLTDPAGYMESSKFLIKMLIVFVIFVNGIIFHTKHLPLIKDHADEHYPSSDAFTRNKKLLIVSGAISATSWTFALILGSLRSIPITFTEALLAYLAIEAVAIIIALLISKRLF